MNQSDTAYDNLGRVYQVTTHAVNPANGSLGNALVEKFWYDPVGNLIKRRAAGAGQYVYEKSSYDGLRRVTKSYLSYDTAETSYADASTVIGDTVMRQTEFSHDAASNLIQQTTRERFHDATATGELTTPGGSPPNARVSYVALYPDPIGRQQARADYGTNGGTALNRSDTIPAASNDILVSKTLFKDSGDVDETIDPAGTRTQFTFDHAGRMTKQIEDYGSGKLNRETQFAYNGDGRLKTLTAKNATTGDQLTKYVYGTTTSDSDVASFDLLRAVIYPDSDDADSPLGNGADGVYDRMEYKYNRLGEVKEIKDQLQTVHVLEYDKLSRLIHDRVSSLGSGVDGAVRRISRTYEVRGLLEKVTSHDNATVGSGTVLNEVQFAYDDFSQLIREFQEHSGVVNTANPGSLRLLYAYASGSANHVRPTSLRYPTPTSSNPTTRLLSYDYASGADANLNRVSKLLDGAADRLVYSYLGLQEIIRLQYSEPGMELTYLKQGSESNGPAGDQYNGLDRFGRCVDQRWLKTSDGSSVERVKYGFDRASNRLWRENSGTTGQDFIHAYDGLNRLSRFRRGDLNGTYDNLTTTLYEQQWTFDPTDNWTREKKDVNGDGTWDWDKGRTHNKANELLAIGDDSYFLAHSLAGNMTKVPQMWAESATWDLSWDAWNRLVKVMDGANTVNQHKYDGLNRRIVRIVGSVNRHYYYSDKWQILEERKDSNTYAERQFFWGLRFVDDLAWRDRDADGDGSHTLEERLYVLNDYFHVTAVANPSGVVQERCWYDAYGYPFVMTGSFAPRGGIWSSLYDWETWYGSYRQDLETALHQVRNRFFHFKLGRWPSRDPIGENGRPNLYAYVRSNPISQVDPLGLLTLQEVAELIVINRPAGVNEQITPFTLICLLWKESSFNPNAANPNSSATGIAQILNRTADDIQDRLGPRWGGSNPFYTLGQGERLRDHRDDPDVSIFAAYIYLDDRLNGLGTLQNALAAYGPNANAVMQCADCFSRNCGLRINPNSDKFEVANPVLAHSCLHLIHP
ncbi:MAG: transglycosylase SLT domain-containing protein [Verrucomicrobiales bacterium]|nr:transglycosylase SLT domain-containing protein [Verrucomicrobiales bacterium]